MHRLTFPRLLDAEPLVQGEHNVDDGDSDDVDAMFTKGFHKVQTRTCMRMNAADWW